MEFDDLYQKHLKEKKEKLSEERAKSPSIDNILKLSDNAIESYRQDLMIYIYEITKDLDGYKMKTHTLDTMDLRELSKLADSKEDQLVEENAYDQASEELYNYQLKQAESNPDDFVVVDNPDYQDYPFSYPGHYPKIIHKKQKPEEKETALSIAMKKAKKQKRIKP